MVQNTESYSSGPPRKRRALGSVWVSNVLGVVGLVIIGLCVYFVYYGWLVLTDNLGTFHNSADVADLDGDGDLDVILHNVRQEAEFTAFGGAGLWINEGHGHFVARRLEEGGAWASDAGDVDQDGDVDLVVFPGWSLRTIFNQGGEQGGRAGEFASNQVPIADAPASHAQFGSVLFGDLNDDGQVDGVVTGCCGRVFTLNEEDDRPNFSWVWINDWHSKGGRGHSSFLTALEGLAQRAAALGDLDGDGDLDLFAAVIAPEQGRNRDPADRVLFNDGSGHFVDSGQRLGHRDSSAVALGDLDGDGDVDALVGNGSGALVWINQGRAQGGREGNFALSGRTLAGGEARSVFLSDLDGDGDMDALTGGMRQATIWWNDGQATFTRSNRHFRYSRRHGVAVEDFDGDDRPDIFAAAYDDDYRVWLNEGEGSFRSVP